MKNLRSSPSTPTRELRLARSALAVTALLAVAVMLVTACGDRIGANGRIAVVYLNAEGYYAGVKEGLQSSLGDLPDAPQVVETNAQSDPSQESTFIDTVSSAGVNALILSPTSAEASIPAVRLAHDSGIPVVCYNTCLTDEATNAYVDAWILGSPREFGAISGRQMGEYFRAGGVDDPKVGIINCEQFEVCIERRIGFEDALRALVPGAEIVANQQALMVDEAVERGGQMITANPDLDAFYGEAGSQTVGAVRAVEARGLAGKIAVFGGDMSTQVAEMLRDGSVLKGVADISGIKVGELTAQATLDVMAGNKPADLIIAAPVDAYLGPQDGERWLAAHPDGIP